MTWKCVECAQTEETESRVMTADSVCVHCGKSLCRHHRVEIVEDAFAVLAEPDSRNNTAVHCTECEHKYHVSA